MCCFFCEGLWSRTPCMIWISELNSSSKEDMDFLGSSSFPGSIRCSAEKCLRTPSRIHESIQRETSSRKPVQAEPASLPFFFKRGNPTVNLPLWNPPLAPPAAAGSLLAETQIWPLRILSMGPCCGLSLRAHDAQVVYDEHLVSGLSVNGLA